jgi:O6-methylguanine-DNA--protein-cysteine methyltransferase
MKLIVAEPAPRETASITSGAAHEIEFVVGDCALGKVLVARSPIGVCAIRFGSTAAEVEQDLTASFPDSRIVSNNRRLGDDLTKVLQFIAVPRDPLDLDLDIRGTPFQRRVWDALRTILFGRPLTYAQLARQVSGPKSLRAIAQACAENPIALAINPLSSRHGQQWIDGGLSLGHRTQAGADKQGSRGLIQMSVDNRPGIRRRVSICRQQPEFDYHHPDLP